MKKNVRKILVIRNDRFGEFLLNIPVIVALKRAFSLSKIVLIVNPSVEQLARRIFVVDELLGWDSSINKNLQERFAFLREIRKREFDMAVILNPSKEFNIISYLAGIPVRLGYDRKWGFLLNYRIKDKKSEGLKHELYYNLELIKEIGVDFDNADISFPLEIEDEDFPNSKMQEIGIERNNFIAVHPWASNPEKEWPLNKFRELALRLCSELGYKIVVIGGLRERERAEEFSSGLPVINLTAKTSLVELAGLFKKGKLLISNDSGPMHLAAVLGIPTVAIFRKTPLSISARRWGPVGQGNIVIENDDISSIKVDEVLDGIKKILRF